MMTRALFAIAIMVPHIGTFPLSHVESFWHSRSMKGMKGLSSGGGRLARKVSQGDAVVDLSPVTLSEVIPGGTGERVSVPNYLTPVFS